MMRVTFHSKPATPEWHQAFLALLSRICHYARFAFRHLDAESKQEAIQNVVAGALNAYARLVQLGKADIAYATPLAMYAIRQHREGRRLGCHLNAHDVNSPYAQKLKGIILERLDKYDCEEECWREILISDQTCTPADLAASRIDFPAWLGTLSKRERRIALKLAASEPTGRVARMFKVSASRVSQLRRAFAKSWQTFQCENVTEAAMPT
jgi:hypothetical protein